MAQLPAVAVTTDDALGLEVDALVVPVFRGAFAAPGAQAALDALGYDEVPRDATFRAKVGEWKALAAPGLACGQVVLVGLGRLDGLDDEVLRRAAGTATHALANDVESIAMTLPLVHPGADALRAVAEGALLGAYRYLDYRSEPSPPRLRELTLVVPAAMDQPQREIELAVAHATAQCAARDLVNLPPQDKSPDAFCQRAIELVGEDVEAEVWDEDRLAAERCGGILAVGQGSVRPPRLLLLHYRPPRPLARIALVGKGITFDAGGLSLKRPSTLMTAMKADMAGAAAVVGALSAASTLGVNVEVLGLCAMAENLPDGAAQRPSDVLVTRSGTTVEVLNTDGEGRLVLADALAYAAEQDLDAIVDLATLTGAAARAVGRRAAAAFSNDDDLLRQVLRAAEEAGESTWHLPLWDDLRDNLDSDVADLNHLGKGDDAHATTAALFLREFVDDTPWVHLDIAGPAWVDKPRHHLTQQGTGTGVRTLLRWLEQTSDR